MSKLVSNGVSRAVVIVVKLGWGLGGYCGVQNRVGCRVRTEVRLGLSQGQDQVRFDKSVMTGRDQARVRLGVTKRL